MSNKKNKVQLPIIHIESRLQIEVIYPNYVLERNMNNSNDEVEETVNNNEINLSHSLVSI